LGTYAFTAVATDDRGARRTSNPITISVLPPDNPPTVSLTAPSNGSTFGVNASIAVNASASDSDGTIAKVEFFVGATLIGSKTALPYTVTWTPTAAGNYLLTAKATDNRGVAVTSNAANVSWSLTSRRR
jgi:chitinase